MLGRALQCREDKISWTSVVFHLGLGLGLSLICLIIFCTVPWLGSWLSLRLTELSPSTNNHPCTYFSIFHLNQFNFKLNQSEPEHCFTIYNKSNHFRVKESRLSGGNHSILGEILVSFRRFEKLDITPKSAQKIKPVLEKWMKEAEDRYRTGNQNLNEFVGMEPSKKRKRRTSFTPQALEILNTHFERNTHPSGEWERRPKTNVWLPGIT